MTMICVKLLKPMFGYQPEEVVRIDDLLAKELVEKSAATYSSKDAWRSQSKKYA